PEEPLVPAARRAGSENATSVASAGRPAPSASGPRREAVVHGTSAVADPETVAGIERDPSVNKSLLLRLIAGVRGL
ncbi:MAG: hypothetical protein M3Z02_00255, partial [Actinomycetota bacterium]|nr:hypothetical protein [Actinomycetota bacterium]